MARKSNRSDIYFNTSFYCLLIILLLLIVSQLYFLKCMYLFFSTVCCSGIWFLAHHQTIQFRSTGLWYCQVHLNAVFTYSSGGHGSPNCKLTKLTFSLAVSDHLSANIIDTWYRFFPVHCACISNSQTGTLLAVLLVPSSYVIII